MRMSLSLALESPLLTPLCSSQEEGTAENVPWGLSE